MYDNTLTNKGILLKSSTAMRAAVLGSGDPTLIDKFEEWTGLKRQIARIYSTEKSKRYQDPKVLEDKATVIERDLVSRSQEYSSFDQTQNIKWNDVQKNLKADEAAIEFVHFDYYDKKWIDTTYYCALILRPDYEKPLMLPIFTEKELQQNISSTANTNSIDIIDKIYGKNRGSKASKIKNVSYADSLSATIWSKIDPYLNNARTVYYSPSGMLHNISFSALKYNDSLLLSDKYKLVYLASTGDLGIKKKKQAKEKYRVALYGGLNYDEDFIAMREIANGYNNRPTYQRSFNNTSRGSSWNYLKGTLEEVNSINSMYYEKDIDPELYTENKGIEESFKSLAGKKSPRIIHLATHGFFFPDPEKSKKDDLRMMGESTSFKRSDNPLMRSGLLMSGANNAWNNNKLPDGLDDGILTAYEVSGLDLFNTELVVLSACETGLGDIKGSEGVYGLQRSFKMAGVDNLIMSLWQVPDTETSEFMQLFYTNMLDGQQIGDAFRATQKVMREKYDPYYWAAFVLIE